MGSGFLLSEEELERRKIAYENSKVKLLTKREHFAIQLMTAYSHTYKYSTPELIAVDAVRAADILIAELDKGNNE